MNAAASRLTTAELLPLIEPLWVEGLSVSAIAARLGVGKCVISGIVYRNREMFAGRPSPIHKRLDPAEARAREIERKREARRRASGKRAPCSVVSEPRARPASASPPRPAPAPAPTLPEPPAPVSVAARAITRPCQWPTGGDTRAGRWTVCGAQALPGHSYCDCHYRVAYTPTPARKRIEAVR